MASERSYYHKQGQSDRHRCRQQTVLAEV